MKKNTLILLAIIIILVILAIFQGRRVSRLSDEVKRQERNVEVLRDHERLYKICDSINVAEIQDTIKHYFRYEIIITTNNLYLFLFCTCSDTNDNTDTEIYVGFLL